MKTPSKTKVKRIKAWAVLDENGKLESPSDIRTTKTNALIYANYPGNEPRIIVPCLISYQLKSKRK